MASPVDETSLGKPDEPIEPPVHTYHCLCTQLILASTTSLDNLPARISDKSHICSLPEPSTGPHYAIVLNTILDSKPTVIRLEDGFEKRYFEKCARCGLTVGYHLDESQYGETQNQKGSKEDLIYLLQGGLLSTQDMRAGKNMEQEIVKSGKD